VQKSLYLFEEYFVVAEIQYWRSVLRGAVAPKVPVLPYVPQQRKLPSRVLPVPTAWKGIESVLADLVERFGIGTDRCLEFGVEHGYSTAALSCFFDTVTGVDTFAGDRHSLVRDLFEETSERLSGFDNIQLVRCDYRDWAAKDDSFYDLIHVDIVHTYVDTLACGLWSAQHARCVLFHDTESFPAVKRAVIDISRETGKRFYNFEESNGLGILTAK
jgi:Methyltransferase domain